MEKNYPEYHHQLLRTLGKLNQELPGPMAGFALLHKQSVAEGALSPKCKELIALSIAIHARCDGCITYHVHDALKAGASRAEILEAIGVAVMMGGGPAAVYACEAIEALDQFEAAQPGRAVGCGA